MALSGKRILYLQYTNPAALPPLEHSSRILADAGWQVLFLGTEVAGVDRLTFPPHPNIRVRRLRSSRLGWRQKLHYVYFLLLALGWLLRWRPQWIYASDMLSCPVAWFLSWLPGHQTIYHEHDTPDPNPASRFFRWCLAARRRLSHRAVVCVVPNEVRARRFAEETGATNVCCVWNCPTTDEVGQPRAAVNGHDIWLHYHGSISPPLLPVTVLEALARLPERVKLRVIGYETAGNPNYVSKFLEVARRLGLAGRIEFLGPMPRHELLAWCNRSDIGLALLAKEGLEPMPGASNKPFDYLAGACALLVPDLPEWCEMYVQPGYARACDPDNPDSIAAALRWFVEHPEQTRAMGEAGRRRILEEWNYEKQFRPVGHYLNHT